MYVSIRIKGHLDPSWQEYLEGLEIVQETDGTTLLSGVLQDQSALYGVLNMMSRLNLTLLSLERSERAQKEYPMRTVISKDGTPIAFDQSDPGPALILVAGALNTRASSSLAARLAQHFSVLTYDRRGRGESGDTMPYAVEREIEDIDALITEAGGSAFLFGHSSGGALALEAALQLGGEKVKKLAIYEVPYNDDREFQRAWRTYIQQLTELLAANRRGDAVALFMQYIGTPAEQIEGMRHSPAWLSLEAIAPTLAYDHAAILGEDVSVPIARAAQVRVPALVMNGGASFPFMYETARTLSQAIPHAQLRTLEGQDHAVADDVLAPVLVEFFKG